MDGPVGVFYRQFSLTLAIAIVISGVNALTLTPRAVRLLLRQDPAAEGQKPGPGGAVLRGLQPALRSAWPARYQALLSAHRWRAAPVTLGALVLFFGRPPGASAASCPPALSRPRTRAWSTST
ncbi:MAG: efflux RND transporter permease subunit [Hymenobacter sp.]